MALRPIKPAAGLVRGPDGTLSVDGADPSPGSGTPAMTTAFIDAANKSWTLSQLAQALAGSFAPLSSGSGSTGGTTGGTSGGSTSGSGTTGGGSGSTSGGGTSGSGSAPASAYTVSVVTQGASTGSTYSGGYAPLIAVAKTADGSVPATDTVKIGGSTSQTTPPPTSGSNNGSFSNADLENGTPPRFHAYPSFGAAGAYYWWVQDPDGVQFLIPGANPITIS